MICQFGVGSYLSCLLFTSVWNFSSHSACSEFLPGWTVLPTELPGATNMLNFPHCSSWMVVCSWGGWTAFSASLTYRTVPMKRSFAGVVLAAPRQQPLSPSSPSQLTCCIAQWWAVFPWCLRDTRYMRRRFRQGESKASEWCLPIWW